MYRTYNSGRVVCSMTGETMEPIAIPTEAQAEATMRRYCYPGDVLTAHTVGYVTTISVMRPDGEALNVRAELDASPTP